MEEEKKISYYEQRLPDLIQKLKNMVDRNMEVVDKETDEDMSSDKFYNVLKGRRQAAEDITWCLKKIDLLEKELSGEEVEEIKPKQSWAKIAASNK
jgi:predicted acetyltransferase